MVRLNGLYAVLLVLAGLFDLEQALGQSLPFQGYSVKDGLVSNNAVRLYQDSQGFLWVATSEGVSSFDGRTFVNYTLAEGLPHSTVRQIIEEKGTQHKSILVLTFSGVLSRIVQGKVHPVTLRSTTGSLPKVLTLGTDHNGTLWAGTDDGVAQVVNDELRPISAGIRMQYVNMIVEEDDSIIWIVCRHSLNFYTHRTKTFSQIDLHAFVPFDIFDAANDHEGNLWLALNGGRVLQIRNRKVVRHFVTATDAVFLATDRDGYLWLGGYQGLSRVPTNNPSENAIEHFTVANGLPDDMLKHALLDKENNLWIAGLKKGIAKLSEKNLYHLAIDGINPPYQYSIGAADSNGHIWVVSRSGLWEIWRDGGHRWHKSLHRIFEGSGNAKPYPVFDIGNDSTGSPRPYSIVCDRWGRLWIGFSNAQIACYRVHPENKKPSRLELVHALHPNVDFPSAFPKCFIVDRAGMVWYSVGDNLILLLDPKKRPALVRTFDSLFGLPPGNYARALLQDRHRNIWAGSYSGGVARLAADSIRTGSFQQIFSGRSITSLMEDRNGTIWIGTAFSGLVIVRNDSLLTRSVADGLPSNIVLTVAEDVHRRIWIGTQAGTVYLDGANAAAVHKPIDLADVSTLCSGTTRSGVLWFVTSDGVTVYDTTPAPLAGSMPSVILTSLSINGRDTSFSELLKLSHRENNLVMHFVAVTFKNQQEMLYQFRLQDVSDEWQPPTKLQSVTFAELPPGEYQFEVRAVRAGVNATSEPATLSFIITPPFWATWWFRAFAFVGVLVSVGGTIRYVEKRKLMRRIEQLEQERALERERARISQDMHDEVGSSLSEIAILSELGRKRPEEAETRMQEISERAAELIDNVGEIVWAMNPKNDTLDNLVAHLRRYAVKYLGLAGIQCTFTAPEDIPAHHLTAEVRRNLFLVVKEALHNVVKHSGASDVSVTVLLKETTLELRIEDNGRGFDSAACEKAGNGLASMSKRVQDIGGTFTIESQPKQGTKVEVGLRC